MTKGYNDPSSPPSPPLVFFPSLVLLSHAELLPSPGKFHSSPVLCLLTVMENGPSSEGKDPSAFLGEIIGAPVIVKLNSGVVYKGTTEWLLWLSACDTDEVW